MVLSGPDLYLPADTECDPSLQFHNSSVVQDTVGTSTVSIYVCATQ